jgi:hypothetical protein
MEADSYPNPVGKDFSYAEELKAPRVSAEAPGCSGSPFWKTPIRLPTYQPVPSAEIGGDDQFSMQFFTIVET